MVLPTARFPSGKYYALTWGISDGYGGMTSALLHRSRAFHRLGGIPVEILTTDDRPDFAELAERLIDSEEWTEGVTLRNLWDDLRERTLAPAKSQKTQIEAALPLEADENDLLTQHGGIVLKRERVGAGQKFVAADRFRRDGSLLATERRIKGGRSIVIYDLQGAPVRRFKSRWKLYHWWLDLVFKRHLSFVVVDSKTSARFMPDYRRDNVVAVHLVHASHREDARDAPLGVLGAATQPVLRETRAAVLKRSGDFDSVVVLTERQRAELLEDLLALGIDARGVIRVIPNGIDLPMRSASDHVRGAGVMLASLDERKRVEHAIDAMVEAHATVPQTTLDVYGGGDRAEELLAQINRQNADSFVSLRGYRSDARAKFASADFSLLTSTSEGLPLVLVEGMAAGCVPIAYDVRYGPADMIQDGVSGYLVEEGDISLLAKRIVELQRMPEAQLRAMRQRAVARAKEFSDEAIAKRWANEFARALDAKRIRAAADDALAIRLRRRAGVVRRRLGRMLG